MKSFSAANLVFMCFIAAVAAGTACAGLNVTPKFVFLDGSRRSVPVHVSNSGDQELEAWIEVRFGYVSSDDTGKITIVADSASMADEPSAAGWIKAFPERFILGVGETQTVRFAAYPPAGLAAGEYWARVYITGKPRKPPAVKNAGVVILPQVGVPFHYRNGSMTTGLDVIDANSAVSDKALNVTMKLAKKGNASYWGLRVMRLINESGNVVRTLTRNVVVYKTLTMRDKIDRADIPSGMYSLEYEFVTGKRMDLANSDLVQSPPVRSSLSVIIP